MGYRVDPVEFGRASQVLLKSCQQIYRSKWIRAFSHAKKLNYSELLSVNLLPALTPKKSGTKAPPRTLCKQEVEQDSYERDGVDFPYMARLRRDVKRHWTPPGIATTRPLVITFDVKRSGDVDKMQVICSSGNDAYDQAAVDAIQHSVPFLPLPDAYKRAIYVILFFRANDFVVILPLDH